MNERTETQTIFPAGEKKRGRENLKESGSSFWFPAFIRLFVQLALSHKDTPNLEINDKLKLWAIRLANAIVLKLQTAKNTNQFRQQRESGCL